MMLCNRQQSHLQQCTCVRPRAHTHTRRARLVRSLTRTRMHAQSFESPNHSEAPTHVRARAHTHTHTQIQTQTLSVFFCWRLMLEGKISSTRAHVFNYMHAHTHIQNLLEFTGQLSTMEHGAGAYVPFVSVLHESSAVLAKFAPWTVIGHRACSAV